MTEKDTTYTKYNKTYYQKNKQRIILYYREHYHLNKQEHIEYVTKYRKEHRTKLNERIYCECGGYYRYCDRSIHMKNMRHITYQNNNNHYVRKISKNEVLLQDKDYVLQKCDHVVNFA
jgi:hypothetical protein